MNLTGDLNAVTAGMSALAAAVVSFVVARAVSVRQARAQAREVARREVIGFVAQFLGHARLTLVSCEGQDPNAPYPHLTSWTNVGPSKAPLTELARALDGLGPVRRRRTRAAARRVWGGDFDGAHLARWSPSSTYLGAVLRSMMVRPTGGKLPKRRRERLSLWRAAETVPSARVYRVLERTLCTVYTCGGVMVPSPRVVTRRRRVADRLAVAWFRVRGQWPPSPVTKPAQAAEVPETVVVKSSETGCG